MQLKQQVENALQSVRGALNSARQPQYPADVPHGYDDKYLLAEFATKAAVAGLVNLLDALVGEKPGWWAAHHAALLKSAGPSRAMTLRFSACERCSFDRTETKDLDSGEKTVTEGFGGWASSTVKTVTTIKEHFWRFNGTFEIHAFPGTREADGTVLHKRTGLYTIKTTTPNSEEGVTPMPEVILRGPLDLDISWLLARAGPGGMDFVVDRSDESKCRTPRRNPDVEAAADFFARLRRWSDGVAQYLLQVLFMVERPNLDALEHGKVLRPVHALFALDSNASGDGQQRIALADGFQAVMAEHRASLAKDAARLQEAFPSGAGVLTGDSATVAALLIYTRELAEDYATVVDAIEGMLHSQLAAAVGKELTAGDFAEYMEFHYRKLFRPELKPSPFSYAVRRPGQSPEGVISVEAPLPGQTGGVWGAKAPIQSVAARREATRPMRFALDAATDVEFLGERYLHPVVLHQFSHEGRQSLALVARARQFSSFLLLVGKVLSAERFEPAAALVVKDRDDLTLPLLLEAIPAPKEFRDAIESLSPEQQRFARAFREMQLSSTLFGLLVIQIKPQMEAVLNLPANSLTKEIQLTQDLMELFIKYQVPSDLLSYDEGSETNGTSKLQVVQEHVAAMLATINASRRRELEDEQAKAESRRLRRGEASSCGAAGRCRAGRGEEDGEELEEAEGMLFGAGPESAEADAAPSAMRSKRARAAPRAQNEQRRLKAMAFGAEAPPVMLAAKAPPVMLAAQVGNAPRTASLRLASHPPPAPMPPSPPTTTMPPPTEPQEPPEQPRADAAGEEGGGGPGGGDVDYAALPGLLDRRFEQLDVEGTLRPTKVKPGPVWRKSERPGLLAPASERTLGAEEQAEERKRAFDLLDALTRSGAMPVRHASLHVVLAATHGFDQTLVDTIIQGNVNPIEKVERSVLIMTSALQRKPPEALVAPQQLARVRRASPGLFAEGGA